MKLSDFFKGISIIEVVDSPVNGKISVLKSLGLGTYFQVGKLTQSGGVVFDIWKKTLKQVKSYLGDPGSILILGLGGGSCAKVARKMWPYSQITGIDFDQTIVDLGKKYLGLGSLNTQIVVSDAFEFLEKCAAENKQYDLLMVDLYVGQEFPVVFESDAFLENVQKAVSGNGAVVFNRLYFGEKRPATMKFGKKLEKYFSKVEYFYPQANVMLICKK